MLKILIFPITNRAHHVGSDCLALILKQFFSFSKYHSIPWIGEISSDSPFLQANKTHHIWLNCLVQSKVYVGGDSWIFCYFVANDLSDRELPSNKLEWWLRAIVEEEKIACRHSLKHVVINDVSVYHLDQPSGSQYRLQWIAEWTKFCVLIASNNVLQIFGPS